MYKPELMVKGELLEFSENDYIKCENWYEYFLYSTSIGNIEEVEEPLHNHLNVVGYNQEIVKLSRRTFMIPELAHQLSIIYI